MRWSLGILECVQGLALAVAHSGLLLFLDGSSFECFLDAYVPAAAIEPASDDRSQTCHAAGYCGSCGTAYQFLEFRQVR